MGVVEFAGLTHNEQKILVVLLKGKMIKREIQQSIENTCSRGYAAYCGINKNINRLRDMGLVKSTKAGRTSPTTLTEKGRMVAMLLKNLKDGME